MAQLEVKMDAIQRAFLAMTAFEERFRDRFEAHGGTFSEFLATLSDDDSREAARLLHEHTDAAIASGTAFTADDMEEAWYAGKVRALERDQDGAGRRWTAMTILDSDAAIRRSDAVTRLRQISDEINGIIQSHPDFTAIRRSDPSVSTEDFAEWLRENEEFASLVAEEYVLIGQIDGIDERHGIDTSMGATGADEPSSEDK